MLTPVKIDNRMNGFLGKPTGGGKRPTVIHLHERYGIVQHTTDLGEKFVQQGYVTIVPDLFSRFTGDRDKLAKGDDRCDLDDRQVTHSQFVEPGGHSPVALEAIDPALDRMTSLVVFAVKGRRPSAC